MVFNDAWQLSPLSSRGNTTSNWSNYTTININYKAICTHNTDYMKECGRKQIGSIAKDSKTRVWLH